MPTSTQPKPIQNATESIGGAYPTTTGRLKKVIDPSIPTPTKVALVGDSTLDNNVWVQQDKPYAEKTDTVTHQTAVALARSEKSGSYDIANFAVDGSTTADLMVYCPLDKVLPSDEDHTPAEVNQLDAISQWKPDVAVLSVAGNNYREALRITLPQKIDQLRLLLRITPEQAKAEIKSAFDAVKAKLLKEYKEIIDKLAENASLKRIVLLSQYYPSISAENPDLKLMALLSQFYPSIAEEYPYYIYTGFSHVARAEGTGKDPFTAVEDTVNELYREVLAYAAAKGKEKGKEIVFADVTSSLNPLGGNHTMQIEPNGKGAKILGRLIAKAVEYTFPPAAELGVGKNPIAVLSMDADENDFSEQLWSPSGITDYSVKKISEFISENRYRHLGLLFSPSSTLKNRYEYAHHLVMGKQFDSQYTGVFTFGLLDISLVTVMAAYLWRVALNDQLNTAFRVTALTIAAPILLSKMILGLAMLLVLALPIYGYHQAVEYFTGAGNSIQSQTNIAPEKMGAAAAALTAVPAM